MPLIRKEEFPLWGIWKIEEQADELFAMLNHEEWYRPFLENVKLKHRREEWLSVRVLLKTLLGREVQIAYRESGMPYLPDESWYISISHTKGYAAVLLTETPNPGIDIEYVSERVKKIAFRFLNDKELQEINPPDELTTLLLSWSAKETIFKGLQEREVDFRDHLYIYPFHPQLSGTFQVQETKTTCHRIYRVNYEVTDQYVVTYIKEE